MTPGSSQTVSHASSPHPLRCDVQGIGGGPAGAAAVALFGHCGQFRGALRLEGRPEGRIGNSWLAHGGWCHPASAPSGART